MKRSYLLALFTAGFLTTEAAFAQVDVGAALMSRYVWRGVDYGDSPSLQPALTFTAGGFSIGTWGAYSLAGTDDGVFSEHDLWMSYDIETESASFSFIVTDYHYPVARLKYFDYAGDGEGAHTIEIAGAISGPESFPISLFAAYNVHNDPDNSLYIELGYFFTLGDVELSLFAGGSTGQSAWYGTTKGALINTGLTVTKSLVITDTFSLPLSASFIVNPDLEHSYLVFGIEF